MKPQIGITLIALIFLGVFFIYSNLPDQAEGQMGADSEGALQANTGVTLGDMIADQGPKQINGGKTTTTHIESANGLDEELQGIIDGFNVITEELQSLEEKPTGPAQ